MEYTAVSYLILVSVQTTLILARNTTSNYDEYNYTHTMSIYTENMTDTMTMMSTMTDATVNVTEMNYTDFTSEGQYSTPPKLPDVTPPPPVKATTKSRLLLITPQPESEGNDNVGIIIVVVIIAAAVLAAIICFVARRKGRRYSMDLSSRPEEAQIPLSTVEPEAPVGAVTLNGLQFEGTDDSTQEPQETHEPEVKLEDQDKVEAEPEKVTIDETNAVTIDETAECAAPPADASEDQSKPDVPEQSPTAPVEPNEGEKTDDAGAASSSVESLKESSEVNENNSNCNVLAQRGARDGEPFLDTSLDRMV